MSSIVLDLDDYIDQFTDADLAREIRSRGYSVYAPPAKLEALKRIDKSRHGIEPDNNPSFEDELRTLKVCIIEGRSLDALALIDRLLRPRFRDIEQCKAEYSKVKAA